MAMHTGFASLFFPGRWTVKGANFLADLHFRPWDRASGNCHGVFFQFDNKQQESCELAPRLSEIAPKLPEIAPKIGEIVPNWSTSPGIGRNLPEFGGNSHRVGRVRQTLAEIVPELVKFGRNRSRLDRNWTKSLNIGQIPKI